MNKEYKCPKNPDHILEQYYTNPDRKWCAACRISYHIGTDALVLITNNGLSEPEPAPVAPREVQPAVWDLVMMDMDERDKVGAKRYGQRLRPHNGRDALIDLYQELLDSVVYCRQAIYERDGR